MPDRPNVVWVTVDSVRGDRTSLAGYDRPTTPNLERIAARESGQGFTQCISHAMWSLPSDASILTGTYPSSHGTGLWNEVLPPEVTTVPERFADLGYHTEAVSQNAYCSDSTGLSRGFEEFRSVNKSNLLEAVGPRTLLGYLLRLRSHSAGYTLSVDRHRSDYLALDVVRRRLRSLEGSAEPFFLFAHTLGAHLPYVPPLSVRDAFTDEIALSADETVEAAYEVSSNAYRAIAEGCEFSKTTRAALDAMYDALVAYVDRYVGELFDYLQSLDLGPTVFVVTADHGDLLGEHGVLGHKLSLHDGLVNVPMVAHGLPSLAEVPRDKLLQQVDVMEVLLDAAGAPAGTLNELQGQDPRSDPRTWAISQRGNDTYETTMEAVREYDPTTDLDRFDPGLLHAVRGERFKWLRSERGEQLYELPDETTDVLDAYPSVANAHRVFLEEFLERTGERHSTSRHREMSERTKDHLADLGYVTE